MATSSSGTNPDILNNGGATAPDDAETTCTRRHVVSVEKPFVIILESPFTGCLGTMIAIDRPLSIGRSTDADVTLHDAALSRRHIEISPYGGGCTVRDLGSRNGTRVNGAEVQHVPLWPGDQVRIGATLLQFHDSSHHATSETWIRKALTSNAVALWEFEADDDAITFSEHADRVLDLPAGTLGGRRLPVDGCVQRDDRDKLRRAAADRDVAPRELEIRLQPTLGLARWVLLRCHPPSAARVLAGTLVDVSSVKRREATLAKTALVFESFLDGVALTDAQGVIVDLNAAMAAYVACERTAAVGKPLPVLVPSLHGNDWFRRATSGLAETGRWMDTLQTDAQTWFDLLAFPLRTEDGDNAGTVWVFRDVSERQRMSAQIAFLDRLASLGTLSAGVAHEINNPLTFILGNAEALREALSRDDQEWMVDALDEIVEGTHRIAGIVRDLKAFSRAETDPTPKATDVKRAVEMSIKMTAGAVRARARVVVEIGALPPVHAVESRLVQVLVNLLVNAAQAMPERDALGAVTIRAARTGHGVTIDVEDTGCGMSPEVKARAFDPFFTTKPLIGTGLGLSICHGLITGMNGTVTLRDTEGGGTTVSVWLPAARRELPKEDVTKAQQAMETRLRVLVVDDEPAVLRTTARLLMEHDVVTAGGFEAAVDLLLTRREPFDVVLCDLMMPDGTGMDLRDRIADERPELVTRMVFVTGGAVTARADEFLRTTTNLHAYKPVQRAMLRSMVRRAAT